MAGGFVKVYGTILQSSIWLESPTTKVVWITMLALADAEGIVRSSVVGLAHSAHVRTADCERALSVLASDDDASQTKTDGGKRIEAHEGGWLILNYRKYRELRTEDQIAAAVRKRRQRERVRDVSRDRAGHSTDKEAEADKEKPSFVYPPEFDLLWNAYPRRVGGNKRQTLRLYEGHLKAGIQFDVLHDGALRYAAYCTKKGWIGTDYVKLPQTFFGRDQHFLSQWDTSDILPGKEERKRQELIKRGWVTV